VSASNKEWDIRYLEQQIRDVTFSTLCALVQVLDLKDLTTGVHSSRLAEWAVTISKLLGLSAEETRQVEIAAVLHDLGKIGIPDEILKKPSKLTSQEQRIMRKHPEFGWAVVRKIPGCQEASLSILHHHEMWDGNGYPAGLKGDGIPLGASYFSAQNRLLNRPHRRISVRWFRPIRFFPIFQPSAA
jgi:HD-GYP domain-containing protein (c-di-GMP phosphodiesterase class II)